MKLFNLTCCLLLIHLSVYAQYHRLADARAEKFVTYFNAGQADSLYTLVDSTFKLNVPVNTLRGSIYQLKNGFGTLISDQYKTTKEGFKIYLALFERTGIALAINFNNADKITGFFTVEAPGSVTIKTDGAEISGTLEIPKTNKPVPVVLLIAGSGPTDRDGNSSLVKQKLNYFPMISDALKAKGVAVLRYDKRGTGLSKLTTTAYPTFDNMVNDVVAIVKYLRADKRFSRIIIAGHSEGSLIGMLAAAQEQVDAFISLSGPGFTIDEVLKTQLKAALVNNEYQKAVLLLDSIKAGNFPHQRIDDTLGAIGLFHPTLYNYLHQSMQYNPAQAIKKLNIPVLIIQGTQDHNVSENDARTLKKAYPKAQLKLITGMNHILKEGLEYQPDSKNIPPLHPKLVPALTQFILTNN